MGARLWLSLVLLVTPQVPAFHTDTRLVVLHVTVRNRRGDLVTNLDRQAFTVYENGKQQPISIFRKDDVPVSVGLLIDNSGSMRAVRHAAEVAALAFADASNPDDELFVINFADKPRLDVAFTSDRAVLERGIARVDAIGGTALRDAVAQAERYLRERGSRDRRVLLIITDGNDNESAVSLNDVVQAAQQRDVVIYAIGLFGHAEPSRAGRHALDALAEHSGGRAYYPPAAEGLDAVARDIAHQIRNQYTLGYLPLDQTMDGTYRSVRVTAHGSEHYYPQTRTGYRAVP
jgi:VWFA-related protein